MGIFADIRNAIWGGDGPERDMRPGDFPGSKAVAPDVATPADNPAMRDIAAGGVQPVSKPAEMEQAQNAAALPTEVDVASVLDNAARDRGEVLDWRHSIVDLMKAVGMEGSLQQRRELAKEFNYEGDMGDTAAMNMFLHKTLFQRISENGGRVPAELLD